MVLSCEDLATKAELQELRDQLNATIGAKEGGGAEKVFGTGISTQTANDILQATHMGLTQTRAGKAITDLGVSILPGGGGSVPPWKAMAEDKFVWQAKTGAGQ